MLFEQETLLPLTVVLFVFRKQERFKEFFLGHSAKEN